MMLSGSLNGPIGRVSLRALLSAAALVILIGCASIVPKGDPPQQFSLTPKTTFAGDKPPVSFQLVIEEPLAAGGLNTSRIVLRPSSTQFDYFADARWTDRAPAMVQTVLIESFESSGRIVAVGRESIGLRSDYNLKLELREFQAEYFDKAHLPTVRVRINAKLVRQPRQEIIASKSFESTWQSSVDDLDDIVTGFDRALGRVMKYLVEWTLDEGIRDRLGGRASDQDT